MKKIIISLIVSILIVSCNTKNNGSDDLCIVLKDGTTYTIPENKISSYYASICNYMSELHMNTGSLRKSYDRFDMTHKDRIAYATMWLIEQGYERRVIYELEKVARQKD